MILLVGDIGGTKTTLALFTSEGGLEPRVQTSFVSNEYPSLAAVAAKFLGETGVSVDRAVFGVAGPVAGGQAMATNLPWVIAEKDLQGALGVGEVKLLNEHLGDVATQTLPSVRDLGSDTECLGSCAL